MRQISSCLLTKTNSKKEKEKEIRSVTLLCPDSFKNNNYQKNLWHSFDLPTVRSDEVATIRSIDVVELFSC